MKADIDKDLDDSYAIQKTEVRVKDSALSWIQIYLNGHAYMCKAWKSIKSVNYANVDMSDP